jgi:hypothetical protein
MDALLAFAAALVALRLTAELVRRRRSRAGAPELAWWAASLATFGLAAGAVAWSSAAGWDDRSFRVYYLCGGLLAAALLGAGSLVRIGWGWIAPVVLLYAGVSAGVMLSEPLTAAVSGDASPDARNHLDLAPARILAIVGNTAGTVAAVAVAVTTLRRRPLGNSLLIAGVAVAAFGSTLAGLGATSSALFALVAACLLYAGFVTGR